MSLTLFLRIDCLHSMADSIIYLVCR